VITLKPNNLVEKFQEIRSQTEDICRPLEIEDHTLQCMDDVSPPKWHLAHVSWFFEEFILKPYVESYREFSAEFGFLFNSYYNAVGVRHPRPKRGHISRPTLKTVLDYRHYIDNNMKDLLVSAQSTEIMRRIQIGLHHEQQHQELLCTDIKYNLFCNPTYPTYNSELSENICGPSVPTWCNYEGGLVDIGAKSDTFAYDNEFPRHQKFLAPYALESRMVTNGDYLQFIDAGGYQHSEFWLSEGWDFIQTNKQFAPLYWLKKDGAWFEYTLAGLQPIDLSGRLAHISYFEADAYAAFRKCRLPYEAEWEHAAQAVLPKSFFILDQNNNEELKQPLGDLYGVGWQWTIDSYLPYPGYRAESGALGEYNGKFMCNQQVLRGGSLFTPKNHIRFSYRNFFPTNTRWQRTGIRLAKSL